MKIAAISVKSELKIAIFDILSDITMTISVEP